MCCNKIRSCNRNDKWVWGTVKHVTLELTTRNTGRWWSSKSYVKMIGKCCREKEKSSGLVMCCVFRSGEREFRGKRMRERCGIFKRQKEEDVTGEVCRCNTCHRLCPVMLCWWCNQSNFSLLSLFHWVCVMCLFPSLSCVCGPPTPSFLLLFQEPFCWYQNKIDRNIK